MMTLESSSEADNKELGVSTSSNEVTSDTKADAGRHDRTGPSMAERNDIIDGEVEVLVLMSNDDGTAVVVDDEETDDEGRKQAAEEDVRF